MSAKSDNAGVRRSLAETRFGYVHIRAMGKGGTPLVLLHHSPMSCKAFDGVQPLFARDRRVLAVDRLGFGSSDHAPRELEMSEYALATLTHFRADSEMALLGFHLGHGLHPRRAPDQTLLENDFAQAIDAHYPAGTGHEPSSDVADRVYHEWQNEEFKQLVEDVKSIPHERRTDVLFLLFDIAGSSADKMFKAIANRKQVTIRDGKMHDMAMPLGNGQRGVSFVSFPEGVETAGERLRLYARAQMYKRKADEWLGLGSIAGSERVVDMIWYNKEPWQPDPELDAIARQALKPGTMMIAGKQKVGRNAKCPCGSGIKYKKCHGG